MDSQSHVLAKKSEVLSYTEHLKNIHDIRASKLASKRSAVNHESRKAFVQSVTLQLPPRTSLKNAEKQGDRATMIVLKKMDENLETASLLNNLDLSLHACGDSYYGKALRKVRNDELDRLYNIDIKNIVEMALDKNINPAFFIPGEIVSVSVQLFSPKSNKVDNYHNKTAVRQVVHEESHYYAKHKYGSRYYRALRFAHQFYEHKSTKRFFKVPEPNQGGPMDWKFDSLEPFTLYSFITSAILKLERLLVLGGNDLPTTVQIAFSLPNRSLTTLCKPRTLRFSPRLNNPFSKGVLSGLFQVICEEKERDGFVDYNLRPEDCKRLSDDFKEMLNRRKARAIEKNNNSSDNLFVSIVLDVVADEFESIEFEKHQCPTSMNTVKKSDHGFALFPVNMLDSHYFVQYIDYLFEKYGQWSPDKTITAEGVNLSSNVFFKYQFVKLEKH